MAALVIGPMEQHERIARLGLALQCREHELHRFHDDLVDVPLEDNGNGAARDVPDDDRRYRLGLRLVRGPAPTLSLEGGRHELALRLEIRW